MSTISVVLTTYNEQTNIERALASVLWANEIIIIDGFSSDNTVEIASRYTDSIFVIPNNEQININKNYGFLIAKSKWILSLDADEEISRELAVEIQNLICQRNEFVAYKFPRKNNVLGKWMQYGNWYPDFQIRLFIGGYAWFNCEHIHELLDVRGRTGVVKCPLTHFTYPSLSTYFRKFNLYTSFEARKLYLSYSKQKAHQNNLLLEKSNLESIRYNAKNAINLVFIKPIKHFFYLFIRQKVFLDGWRGVLFALFSAVYYQITFFKYVYKHFILQNKP